MYKYIQYHWLPILLLTLFNKENHYHIITSNEDINKLSHSTNTNNNNI